MNDQLLWKKNNSFVESQTNLNQNDQAQNRSSTRMQLMSTLPPELYAALGLSDTQTQLIRTDSGMTPFVASLSFHGLQQSSSDASHDNTNLFTQKFKESGVSTTIEHHHTPSKQSLHSHMQEFCQYHPNKKVKYIINQECHGNIKVCSKCAVQLALEKNQVQQIESQKDEKKRQTDSFLDQLNKVIQLVGEHIEKINQKEIRIKEFYDTQFNRVVQWFCELEQKIQQSKQQVLQKLSESQWKLTEHINYNRLQCKQIHQLLTYQENDIQKNYDSIIRKVDQLTYNQIMGGYTSKLHKYQTWFAQVQTQKTQFTHFVVPSESIIQQLEHCLVQLENFPSSPLRESRHSQKQSQTRSSSEKTATYQQDLLEDSEKRHSSQPILKNHQIHSSNLNHIQTLHQKYLQMQKCNTHNINLNDKSTFKITEESVEDWLENSNKKSDVKLSINGRQRGQTKQENIYQITDNKENNLNATNNNNFHLQTEPNEYFKQERVNMSPNIKNIKSSKQVTSATSSTSRNLNAQKHSENQKIINTLLLGLTNPQQRSSLQKEPRKQAKNFLNNMQNQQTTQLQNKNDYKNLSKTPEIGKQKQTAVPYIPKNSPKFLFKNYYK